MGRLATVWTRVKADSVAKEAVCVDLQTQVTQAREAAPDEADQAALAEMEALYPPEPTTPA